ncbi:MAG: hypothetical protein V1757_08420 [Actinomycetota bacterium]
MRGAIRIRDKKVIRRVRRIAEETGQPASEIAERAIDAYITAYEAARSSANTHMDEHEDLIARVREGDAVALRDLLEGFEGARLRQAE